MMKIALDATPLVVPTGGVRRYTEELSRALAERFPEDEIWLVSDQGFEMPESRVANLKAGRGPSNFAGRRWWLWGLEKELSRLEIDVFHGTEFAVPYRKTRPSVMTLHDLSPWMDSSWHSNAGRVRRRTPVLLKRGLATFIITPSEAVRRQAIARFSLAPDLVVAVPHAAGSNFRPVEVARRRAPYLLYVGTLEPRKNVPLVVEVWREVREQYGLELILAGRRREDFRELESEPGLHVLGMTEEEELPGLYAGADAVLYPSYYEGFGLPVLEAMQCGAAVMASRDEAILEVAGEGAVLIDAGDRRGWVDALRALLEQPGRALELRAQARSRAAEFSWAKTAERTREVYGRAVERFRKKT